MLDYKRLYSENLKKVTYENSDVVGLCPFHSEHTPSFHADVQTGLYQCFGCGEKGNIVTFLSKIYNISTKEAYHKYIKQDVVYAVRDYANDKKLPLKFLYDLGIKNCRF